MYQGRLRTILKVIASYTDATNVLMLPYILGH